MGCIINSLLTIATHTPISVILEYNILNETKKSDEFSEYWNIMGNIENKKYIERHFNLKFFTKIVNFLGVAPKFREIWANFKLTYTLGNFEHRV